VKKILLFLFIFLDFLSKAQLVVVNPDTVCYQNSGSIYQVLNEIGTTYTWTVLPPGVLISGQGTNTISVDWSSASPGLIQNAVSVFATNSSGCTSPNGLLDVFILNISPFINSMGPYCIGDPCVQLSALPSGGSWSGFGVAGNQFCSNLTGVGNFNIVYSIVEGGCLFTSNFYIEVLQIATITPISHN
jgi:hypothetical protein